jgi:hypothetical protein
MEENSKLVFSDRTKNVCYFSFLSMFLILIFIISPISNLFLLSSIMKLIIIIILVYTIYLNLKQCQSLSEYNNLNKSKEFETQLNLNILYSYIFTLFLGLLLIFTIKNMIS